MKKDKNVIDALPVGTVLAGKTYRYTIEKVLDQGAFGITYKATVKMEGALGALDTGVTVAIKEFFMEKINCRENTIVIGSKKNGTFSYYKEKFIKEAISLSKLNHPNIVKVVEQFEANNTAYYVMEFIAGGSLDKKIASCGKLNEEQIINYTRQIGAALQFMHSKHMLHLDLKPKNVMLTADDIVKLIDFGLSKQFDDSGKPETSTTIGNGTPGYAPLEQANYSSDSGDFPATMDIYAFGATIFKMATGHRPPDASDILNDGFPSDELSDVSDKMKSIIKKAMSPTKKERFQNVSQLVDGLYNKQENKGYRGSDDETEIKIVNVENSGHIAKRPQKLTHREIPEDTAKIFFRYFRKDTNIPCDVELSKNNAKIDGKFFRLTPDRYNQFLQEIRNRFNPYITNDEERTAPINSRHLSINAYDKDGDKIISLSIVRNGAYHSGNLDMSLTEAEYILQNVVTQIKNAFFNRNISPDTNSQSVNPDKRKLAQDKDSPKNSNEAVSHKYPHEVKYTKWVIGGLFVLLVLVSVGYIFSNRGPSTSEQEIAADTIEVSADEQSENSGAPLSIGEKEDGLGGYDDNAEGYFSMYSDTYVTPNQDVYFDGYSSDSKGKYPISLKFELDDNWHAGVCYYHNVDYNTKLKMNVRFTEEKMIIIGDAGGSAFVMEFKPTSDGKWSGYARNGNLNLKANIWPVKMP